eukprot:304925_1
MKPWVNLWRISINVILTAHVVHSSRAMSLGLQPEVMDEVGRGFTPYGFVEFGYVSAQTPQRKDVCFAVNPMHRFASQLQSEDDDVRFAALFSQTFEASSPRHQTSRSSTDFASKNALLSPYNLDANCHTNLEASCGLSQDQEGDTNAVPITRDDLCRYSLDNSLHTMTRFMALSATDSLGIFIHKQPHHASGQDNQAMIPTTSLPSECASRPSIHLVSKSTTNAPPESETLDPNDDTNAVQTTWIDVPNQVTQHQHLTRDDFEVFTQSIASSDVAWDVWFGLFVFIAIFIRLRSNPFEYNHHAIKSILFVIFAAILPPTAASDDSKPKMTYSTTVSVIYFVINIIFMFVLALYVYKSGN